MIKGKREKKIDLRSLSPANFEIMKIVWEKGEVSVGDVYDTVNKQRHEKLKRSTIQVQIGRLVEYGWLKPKKKGRTFYYSASREKQNTRKDILMDIKKRVFGGSSAELMKCLFDTADINPDEINELRDLIEEYEEE